MSTTTDHETNVREKANALHDAIRDAEAAGYRVTYPGSLHDLPAIAVSDTARINPPLAPGDEYEKLSKTTLQEIATARGLDAHGNKTDLIAALRAPPQPAGTAAPKATTTIVP